MPLCFAYDPRLLSNREPEYPVATTTRQFAADVDFEVFAPKTVTKQDLRSRIADIGIIPAVRMTSEDDALFAAEALVESGIPIMEVSATFPGFLQIIDRLCHQFPDMIVGAGSLFDLKTARQCLAAGARFLSSDGSVLDVMEFASLGDTVVVPGALTPTEIIAAWKSGVDFVKVTPCDAMGGENYIRSLKTLFPQVHFVASGGVNQNNALGFMKAGATALGVGKDLLPAEAIRLRQAQRIQELARRFLTSIDSARS